MGGKTAKILLTVLVTCYLLLVTASVANAAIAPPLVPCGECVSYDAKGVCTQIHECDVCDLFLGAKNIVNYLVLIAAPIAVVILIYGGLMLLTSGGSETKISKGKNALAMAVWGIIIVLAGWLIVDTILRSLVNGDFIVNFWAKFPGCP